MLVARSLLGAYIMFYALFVIPFKFTTIQYANWNLNSFGSSIALSSMSLGSAFGLPLIPKVIDKYIKSYHLGQRCIIIILLVTISSLCWSAQWFYQKNTENFELNYTQCILQFIVGFLFFPNIALLDAFIHNTLSIQNQLLLKTSAPLYNITQDTEDMDIEADFGKKRKFGTFAFGISALILGLLDEYIIPDFKYAFPVYSLSCTLLFNLFLSYYMCSHVKYSYDIIVQNDEEIIVKNDAEVEDHHKVSIANHGLGLTNPKLIVFYIYIYVFGFLMAPIQAFLLFILSKKPIHLNIFAASISIICTIITEMMIQQHVNRWYKQYGIYNLLIVAALSYSIRTALYPLIFHFELSNWMAGCVLFPVELLHGVTFGLANTGGSVYIAELSTHENRASLQGYLQAIYEGLGLCSGTICAGLILYYYDAKVLYWSASLCMITCSIIIIILVKLFDGKNG